ncbi:betaine-aldehyde dehydrogenase [Amycolatopsis bartoniae]|uniref:Aldehyde dehydrogenase n=1 Tax=Amycolatopsis bartoniae TaxID=941986 RepID=A0A8H9M8T7_9PSEU|nr:aldehyde dehydrogenase [Amycolatopsis bartoniae]MBB2939675.1 betaine-aldehyde dehydrogenase [Amycolatopsis bartoniae]TVT06203.1 aldehyde dehydrogenase [Amycolatopsis bartoniae]GHF36594.1 aldehyde dehydrogenase [Amycolatopsis bartoniae]
MTTNTLTAQLPGLRDRDTFFAGGRWVEAHGDTIFPVVNPATEEEVARVREVSGADVDFAVGTARSAFDEGPWPTWSGERRAEAIDALADGLERRLPEISALATIEVGVPSAFGNGQGRAVALLRYYAGQARSFPFRTDRVRPDGGTTRVLREPAGVVAAIAPWNGPLSVAALKLGPALASGCTAALKLGPALASGCTAVLKPAPETPLTTYVLAEVVQELVEAGTLPEGVVSVLAAGREIGATLVAHPGVDKITFTGSTAAGKRVMAIGAERIARVTLELGGKSAAIIADDAPLADVLPSLVPGGCGNTGQMCFALTRVLVSEARHDEFVDAMGAALSALKVGDPTDPATTIGPLALERQRDRVESYLALAREEGATVAVGGGRPAGLPKGFYFEPTLLTNVRSDMRIAQEEIFGPVISVLTYRDLDDAVAIANDSIYGLSGSVYTADVERGYEIARRVRTGTISVNGAVFDTTVPFGGYKQSGTGREGGPEGMEPFLEYKSVHMPA